MPTAVVLADKYERYELTYEGCHVFNPGRFVSGGGAEGEGGEFEWAMYYPATGRSERRWVAAWVCELTISALTLE